MRTLCHDAEGFLFLQDFSNRQHNIMINIFRKALTASRKFIESVQGLATESPALNSRQLRNSR